MNAIGNTLQTLQTSMLSEINTYNSNKAPSTNSATSVRPSTDSVDFSQAGQLLKELKQLQTSDPAEFKKVLSDAAAQLKTAAGQQTDPAKASFLNDLSDRFQKAADTGDLSALKPNSPAGGSYRAHGHHGHGHKPDNDADVSSTSTSISTTTASDPTSLMKLVTQSLTARPSSQTGSQIQGLLTNLINTTT